jgi:hypothetical protein
MILAGTAAPLSLSPGFFFEVEKPFVAVGRVGCDLFNL